MAYRRQAIPILFPKMSIHKQQKEIIMTVNVNQLPAADFSHGCIYWNDWLGLGNPWAMETYPLQEGSLFAGKCGLEKQDVFVVRFMTGQPVSGDFTLSAVITYGDLEIYRNDHLTIPDREDKDFWIQVNQTYNPATPINYQFAVKNGTPGNLITPGINVLHAERNGKVFGTYSKLDTCRKGDPDYGIIVDRSNGELYKAPWYNY